MQSKKIIIKPIFTEKSMQLVSKKNYMFEVERFCSKNEVAEAVNKLFEVEVVEVRTHIRSGKSKRSARTRKVTRTAPRKIAIVELKEGQSIAGFDKLLEVETDGN